jgi:phosphoglycerate dehydrogenase-like enzyme
VVLCNAPDTVVLAVQKGEASLQAVKRQYTGIQAVQCRASGRGVVLCNAPDTAVTAVQEGEVSLRLQEVQYQYQSTSKVAVPEE